MLEKLRKQPALLLLGEGLALVGLIGLFDYLTGPEIAFSIFYAVPIGLMVWGMGLKAGIGFSMLSALVWLGADLMSGHPYSHAVIPYWNAAVRLGFFTLISLILAALRNALDREFIMARTDGLTGAANGRQFEQAGSEAIARLAQDGEPFTLVYVDLDNFKQVNDRFGHARGDTLLGEACMGIRSVLRKGDTVARLGGDEFGVILTAVGADRAQEVVSRIHGKLSLPSLESELGVGASIGAVTVSNVPRSFDDVIKAADAAMYAVKSAGKKGFECREFRAAGN